MKQMRFNRFVAVLLIGVLLIGAIPGAMPARAAGEFSVAFAEPYAAVGKPMTLDVQGASGNISYSWTVDGVFVSAKASYAPTADDLMKWITVTVTSGSDEAELEMFFSKLPVVYINTEGGQAITSKEKYIDAELVIQGNETYNSETTKLYDGATEIRGRGNSTWNQPKKPYRLKLDKKTDLFGMGKSKHWVLLANYLDESLQRNTLAYNLSGAMDMEQMSTVFVDVILNGDFVGNYQLCENIRIDDTRVDIFDWEGLAEDAAAIIAEAEDMDEDTTGDLEEYMVETDMGWITSGSFTFNGTRYSIADYSDIEIPDISGGYLLELDEYYDEVSKFRTDNNQPIMFKSPEFVNTNKDMIGFVKDYVQAFEDAVQAESYTVKYDGETVHYSDLYDFDALVDYWLINEIFFNEELNKKSTYMYKDIDGLMFMGPIWDMDWSSGGEGQTYHTEQWATRYYSTHAQSNQWYKYLIEDPYFFTKAQERYWEIRNNQVVAMLKELDDNYELLKESAAANGERWGYKHDYDYYVDGLRDWFAKHLVWLDAQMATQGSLRNSLDYKADGLTLSLTDDQGKALAADTTAVAPADAVAELGASVKLNIQGGKNTSGTAVLYVNGRRVSETALKADSTTVVQVPDSALTASAGEKNVLEVKIDNGSYEESAGYITVILRDPDATDKPEDTTPTEPEVTDPTEPEASEPDASEPDASEPDASEPEDTKPEDTKPEDTKPDASEPDASEPDASEPEATTPEESKPVVPNCPKDDTCILSQFDDIVVTEWYHDGIHFCVDEGIMNGMGEGKFAPNENTTRAQLVMMLYRLAGAPGIEGQTEPFSDVADTDWFYAPIVWAYENEVVNGVSETEFAPNASVTREQVATILYRYLGEPEGTGKLEAFPDVADVSEYAVAPLTWAVGEGLITGIAQADGTALLAPTGNATRAQIATILMRHLTK